MRNSTSAVRIRCYGSASLRGYGREAPAGGLPGLLFCCEARPRYHLKRRPAASGRVIGLPSREAWHPSADRARRVLRRSRGSHAALRGQRPPPAPQALWKLLGRLARRECVPPTPVPRRRTTARLSSPLRAVLRGPDCMERHQRVGERRGFQINGSLTALRSRRSRVRRPKASAQQPARRRPGRL